MSAADWNPADATAFTAAVESGRLMADLHEFARRVKLSGTPQELESFRGATCRRCRRRQPGHVG